MVDFIIRGGIVCKKSAQLTRIDLNSFLVTFVILTRNHSIGTQRLHQSRLRILRSTGSSFEESDKIRDMKFHLGQELCTSFPKLYVVEFSTRIRYLLEDIDWHFVLVVRKV